MLCPVHEALVRTFFKVLKFTGRNDLAGLAGGHDITRSAPNYSWFRPLGSLLLVGAGVLVVIAVWRRELGRLALLCALLPAYWCVAFGVAFFYQEWSGRFFVFAVTVGAATWGVVMRYRPVVWAVVAVAATTLVLVLVNDTRRPAGIPLLQRAAEKSIWLAPSWRSPGNFETYPVAVQFLDEHVPKRAPIGL